MCIRDSHHPRSAPDSVYVKRIWGSVGETEEDFDEFADGAEGEPGDGAVGVAHYAGRVDDEHAAPREAERAERAVRGGDEDSVMMAALEAGADDVSDDGDGHWRITCEPNHVFDVRDALVAAKLEVVSAESTMVSSLTVEVTDADDARKILRIIDALEDNDDVQDVYSNFDISDELMEAVGE